MVVDVSTVTARNCVVTTGLHGFGGEDGVQAVSIRLLVDPGAYCGEHVAVDFEAFVAEGWVVEDAHYVGHYFLDWDAWVLPCVENASENC